jgi:putative heme degradation protein
MFADFSAQVGNQLRKLQLIEDTDLAAVNKLLAELRLPVVFLPPRKAAATP